MLKANTVKPDPTIFREYDIRGVADIDPLEIKQGKPPRAIDLTADHTHLIGQAYGTLVRRRGGHKVVLGRDNRASSLNLAWGMISGLRAAGVDVYELGLCTTPMVYFSTQHLKMDAGAMITGSHNPMWSNGIKLNVSSTVSLKGAEIQALYQMILDEDFESGAGSIIQADVKQDYMQTILDHTLPQPRKLKVVVDLGNAAVGLVAPDILRRLGHEIITINERVVYPFPEGAPDPEQTEKMKKLGARVLAEGADVGIAYDGDADRVGVVDRDGKKLESDMLLLLYARQVLAENPGAEVIFDVKCSDVLAEDILAHGGVPLMSATGHSVLKARLMEEAARGVNALLAGELSGHMFFRDRWYGFDDGIYGSCRILEILSHSGKSIAEMLEGLPHLYSTRELALPSTDQAKFDIVQQLKEELKADGYEIIDIDGVRVVFGRHEWGLVRPSNTQPKLTARFQAPSLERLEQIIHIVGSKLEKIPGVDLHELSQGLAEAE